MESTLTDALRALRESTETARNIQTPVDPEFLRLLALVEALPANLNGADKSWIWNADRAFKEHYKRVRPA
jgi:hypothetical protein